MLKYFKTSLLGVRCVILAHKTAGNWAYFRGLFFLNLEGETKLEDAEEIDFFFTVLDIASVKSKIKEVDTISSFLQP